MARSTTPPPTCCIGWPRGWNSLATTYFAHVGYRSGEKLPSIAPYLRTRYHLPPQVVAEAGAALREILDKYDREHG